MNFDMLLNLILGCMLALLGLGALIGAIFFDAYWHFLTAVVCILLAYILFSESLYDNESIISYFSKISKRKQC